MTQTQLYILSLSRSYQGESEIHTKNRKKRRLLQQQSRKRQSLTKQSVDNIHPKQSPETQLPLIEFQVDQTTEDEISIFHPLLTGWTQLEYDELIEDQQESGSVSLTPSLSIQLELFGPEDQAAWSRPLFP